MNMSIRRYRYWRVASIAATLVFISLLVGCGGQQATPGAQAAPSPTPSAAPITPTVTPPAPTAKPTATAGVLAAPTTPPLTAAPDADGDSLADRAWNTTLSLAAELSPRESATGQEMAAAQLLAERLTRIGYQVEIQPFDAVELFGAARLAVPMSWVPFGHPTEPDPRPDVVRMFAMPLDPGSLTGKERTVRGEFVLIDLAAPPGSTPIDVAGKIALAQQGPLSLDEAVARATEAGAAAVVVVRQRNFFERMSGTSDIPAVAIVPEQAEPLERAIDSGTNTDVEVINPNQEARVSRNVIAEFENGIDGDQVLVIGAHYDTTPNSPGANDNGTGVAVVLALAEELADDQLPFDLRLVLFGAEETGLNGSFHYVHTLANAERSRILAMLNIDSVGTGNIAAIATGTMLNVARDVAESLGIELPVRRGLGTLGSDHLPFQYAGVDVLALYADDLSYINTPVDTVDHLDPIPLGHAVTVLEGVVDRLARGLR